MASAFCNSMKRILALTILLTGCQSGPIAHDAPVRLFHPNVPTPNGQPHPGWSYALRERMRREDRSPLSTPMDAADAGFMSRFPTPTGLERDILLWKPLRRDASAQTVNYDYRDQWGLLPLFPLRK